MAGIYVGNRFPTNTFGGTQPAPKPAPAPYTPNPAGFTTTQNNGATPGVNPTGSTGSGYSPGNFSQTPGSAPVPGVSPTGITWNVDPTGKATPYTPYSNPGGETFWRPGDGTDLNDLAIQNMLKLFGSLKGFGSMGGPQDPIGRETPGPMPGREVPSTMADRTAMEAAQFGRAKDRIGQIGGAAMSALKDRSTAGGRSNSGLEAKDRREIVQGTQGELGQVVRDQAIDALGRSDQIDDRNLNAGIAQRGQDIGMRSGDYAGNIQQRGQDYNALLNPYQNPLLSMVPSLFGMFAPRY